jgi:glycosyltransferase involved in cell wall biosynthesis
MIVKIPKESDTILLKSQIASRQNVNPLITLIVPVFNEENSLDIFIARIDDVLGKASLVYEFLFINDGSTDNTLPKLINHANSKDNISIINFSRNFGKEAAITAGIDHANGDVVVPIDVDLQDPPEVIIEFIKRWREGYDMVYGLRTCRKSESLWKRFSAKLFYRLFNRFSFTQIPENVGDFRLLDSRVVKTLRMLPERNRFMKGLFSWIGFNSIAVAYERPVRENGKSKWSCWRLWNFAIDGIVSFSSIPLCVWGYVGLIVSLLSFVYGLFIVGYTLVVGIKLPGYASLMTVILFLGGIQLFSIGIVGQYVGRLIIEVKNRPIYIVDSIYRQEK